jgi:hypothetical protein
VSKDLNVPWHKIEVEHFQEWERRGFKKARRGEYENFSTAEKERMMTLMSGASLRSRSLSKVIFVLSSSLVSVVASAFFDSVETNQCAGKGWKPPLSQPLFVDSQSAMSYQSFIPFQ